MKGIILAGGTGSRLWPMTRCVSKQLLPVYDKPMIYYPISTLMLAGVKEILIITTPHDQPQFKELLGDGSDFGVSFEYAIQPEPKGLAQAFTIGEEFLSGDSCLMILGDNIFHGAGLGNELERLFPKTGCHIFTYRVANPGEYGILTLNADGTPQSIAEKPVHTNSDLAVTGLYFFDARVSQFASRVTPSPRGELEITSLIQSYLDLNELTFTQLTRGAAWLDTGRPASLHDASSFVRVLEERTGLKVACLEEIALNKGWITKLDVTKLAAKVSGTEYGSYLYAISK
jgi:glucose-1-phosphate thymidylyltransferase